jgi:hypothetical protein
MTSNSAPAPYVASASSEYGGFPAFKAFDNLANPYWISGNGIVLPHWLKLDLGSAGAIKPHSYAVRVNSVPEPARAPQAWTLEGSNDNFATAGVVLDTRTAQTTWGNAETMAFTLASLPSTTYRYYRINISANNGDALTQVAELYLYRVGTLTVPAITVYANNAAAIAGGLTVGQLYRSGADPSVVSVVF